jgi:hypothetical protein
MSGAVAKRMIRIAVSVVLGCAYFALALIAFWIVQTLIEIPGVSRPPPRPLQYIVFYLMLTVVPLMSIHAAMQAYRLVPMGIVSLRSVFFTFGVLAFLQACFRAFLHPGRHTEANIHLMFGAAALFLSGCVVWRCQIWLVRRNVIAQIG